MPRPPNEITLRKIGVDDWQLWRQLRLQALGEAPYAFSSTLADWQGSGDTERRWRGRLSDVPFNVVAEWQNKPAGMVSATAPDPEKCVQLISMWVAPFARGRGVGDWLVNAVIEWAQGQQARGVVLAVFETNDRAVALYRRRGFIDAGPITAGPMLETSPGAPVERKMVRDLRLAPFQPPLCDPLE